MAASARVLWWGVLKRFYFMLGPLLLDPFDIVERLTPWRFDLPDPWTPILMWALFFLGLALAITFTVHELVARAANADIPRGLGVAELVEYATKVAAPLQASIAELDARLASVEREGARPSGDVILRPKPAFLRQLKFRLGGYADVATALTVSGNAVSISDVVVDSHTTANRDLTIRLRVNGMVLMVVSNLGGHTGRVVQSDAETSMTFDSRRRTIEVTCEIVRTDGVVLATAHGQFSLDSTVVR